jgi:serine/threonine protein kinase/formylglycine-generating enzyme required for sulfatase activity
MLQEMILSPEATMSDETQSTAPQNPSPAERGEQACDELAAGLREGGAAIQRTGRYRVLRRLGGGGFGQVYLCHDERTQRDVALKVPRPDRLTTQEAMAAFLREARNVARLDHPGIVPLYDLGEAGDQCYLVYKFIEGVSLGQRMAQGPVPPAEAARIIARVAEVLDYAHGQNLFHRDIKPGNILLDRDGNAHLTDFGLAVREEDLALERGYRSGTYPYMSPEQVRGEGHRIDGRTDIYSLGVVLYELLCGRRPFEGSSEEVAEAILHRDARPPRQMVPAVGRDLERICLKALSKQMSARYATGRDMAEELLLALQAAPPAPGPATVSPPQPSSSRSARPVVPKGLRSFGPEDRAFYLDLLPGPRDRHGLPESIGFWKTRVESQDAGVAFAVALLYGPSGCGKSSLVKAGLLPRLAGAVRVVLVEATPDGLEARLARELRKACPELGPEGELPDLVAGLRRGQALPEGVKVLLVIDQLEQWLHAHGHDLARTRLVAALRHADGEHVQALLLVRDDFWMGVSRLFDSLEINLDREHNARAVDLFDPAHARRVLRLFGQAFNRLPSGERQLAPEQEAFLERAVQELSQEGRVISVRLSLFAELMKERPWTPAALDAVGGAEGVGVRFLQETFTARTAVPDHRALEKPARALLQGLLPPHAADIKGQMQSRERLAAACGLPAESPRFRRLLDILDRELHVITPAEPEGAGGEVGPPESASPVTLYQLTHDFLVPSLRQWLTQERQRTWRGRAELCLEERTAQWGRTPERRFLPSAWEALSITLAVPKKRRTPEQQTVMRTAARYHGLRVGVFFAVAFLLALLGLWYAAAVRTAARRQQTETLVNAVLDVSPEGLPYTLDRLRPFADLAVPLLQGRFRRAPPGSREQLHAALALAALGERNATFLVEAVATAPAAECRNLVAALRRARDNVAGPLLARASRPRASTTEAMRYATVLLHLGEPAAARRLLQLGSDPGGRTTFLRDFESWHGDLTVVAEVLRPEEDAALCSGLCAAVGTIRPDTLASREQRQLRRALRRLYQQAHDGGTHSAAGWALRKWGVPLPEIQPSPRPVNGRHWFRNSLGMTLVEIPPGQFVMGEGLAGATAHRVTLTRPFFASDCEVTVAQFGRFYRDPDCPAAEKPVRWRGPEQETSPAPDCPVQRVNWEDAVLFCNWLSRREGRRPCYRPAPARPPQPRTWVCDPTADGYRLPTEAEWEWACRAGSAQAFAFGNDPEQLAAHGIFRGNSRSQAWPVGSKLPNGWGLFDMHGNVAEWCQDYHGAYGGDAVDPQGPGQGASRVQRGGGWYSLLPSECRSAARSHLRPEERSYMVGFRVACRSTEAPQPGVHASSSKKQPRR